MDNDNIELEDRNDFNDIQLLMDKLIQDQIEYYVVYKKKLRTSTEVRTHFHWEVQGFNSFYPIFKQRLLNYLRTKKNIPLSVFKDPYTYFFKKSVLYGDIRQRVEEKGYILKTNEYDVIIRILETSNTDTITIDIECKRGHPESLSLNTFRRKGQCSYCLGESLIHNYDDYLILGQENDLILETVREDFQSF